MERYFFTIRIGDSPERTERHDFPDFRFAKNIARELLRAEADAARKPGSLALARGADLDAAEWKGAYYYEPGGAMNWEGAE